MRRVPATYKPFRAVNAFGAVRSPVSTEDPETIQPYIHEIICPDISLHQLRLVDHIQAGTNISVAAHTGGQYARPTGEAPGSG